MSIKPYRYCLVLVLIVTAQFFALILHAQGSTNATNTNTTNTDSLINNQRKKIHDTYNYLVENNRFTEFLDLNTVVDFPIGIRKTIGNMEYVIAIDSVVITPTYAFLNASMSFQTSNGDRLAFRGTDIRFTSQGGLSGDARLELVGDFTINMPGDGTSLTFKGGDTFVEWDCDGFKQFNLVAALNFSRDLLLPIDVSGNVLAGEVAAEFSLNLEDWNDLVTTVNIQPFEVTGLHGFSFYIEDAIFDFSDFRNPPGVKFPDNYQSPYFIGESKALWRGVFIRSVVVNLPSQFEQEDGKRPQIFGANLLIDRQGLSGDLGGRHLLTLGNSGSGSMQGWPFSIDKIDMNFNAGRLTEATINGEIILPVSDQNTSLQYDAFIDHENNYFFNIAPTDSLSFALWKAGEVKLYESSFVNVEVVNGKFTPSAKLNGRMTIDAPIGSLKNAKIVDIEFEDLSLGSAAPYVYGGVFSTGSDQEAPKMSGFDLDIEKIGLRTNEDSTLSLDIDAGIILSGNKGGSFAASGGFSIISENNSVSGRTKLSYKKTKVNKISLNVDNDAFTFFGRLEFYDSDPVYGDGFMGNVDASFKPGIGLQATARFGTVNSMKYWYVDALATFNKPITIGTGFGIYGFGGGARHHMKMKGANQNQANAPGKISYVPDINSGLGLRAAVSFGSVPTDDAYKGDASFEILFYSAGGIKNINFKGEVKFMTPPVPNKLVQLQSTMKTMVNFPSNAEQPEDALEEKEEETPNENGSIKGNVNINYDFGNRILHGNIAVFVNVAGGVIKGTGASGRAGWAVLHFAPEEWYVHIGTPQNRLGLTMGVGSVAAEANGYFMVGTNMPASPPPNENVGRILGGMNLDYMRDENALGLGAGFALGASLNFNTGNLNFWKFYARFMAGAGFDLMLKNYGQEVRCANLSSPMGINGWYANGQAYAFFDGKIGVRVTLFGKKQEVDIISLAAAAVLQAKLPNPVWMRGVVGGYFNILGGLVKGECKFEATIGEECDLQGGSAVSGIKVIADITPASGDADVSVFNNPQAVFNMPIGKVFELVDIDNQRKSFRIKLDFLRVRSEQGIIQGDLEWNTGLDVAVLNSQEILPPESEIKAEVQISFEKKQSGQWLPITDKGNIVIERLETTFTTGTAPDYIPLNNIVYSYPVVEMVNFYPEEYDKGYIQLIKGQAYLFKEDKNWQKTGRMTSGSGDSKFQFVYNEGQKRVDFDLPNLTKDQIYGFQLVSIPLLNAGAIDRNVKTTAKSVKSESGSEVSVRNKQAEGSIDDLQENILFTTKFRTSKYASFNEKLAANSISSTMRVMVKAWDQHRLRTKMVANEYFDYTELQGNKFTGDKPLLTLAAVLENNSYYKNDVYPLVYANYPIDGVAKISMRDTAVFEVPPTKAVEINYQATTAPASFMEAVSTINTGRSYLIYNLPLIYRLDYFDIREQVIPLYIYQPPPLPAQVNALLFHSLPFVNEGTYKVRFNYTLPGQNKVHSSYIVNTALKFNFYREN